MLPLIVALFTAGLEISPLAYVENPQFSGFSYVCYSENGTVQLMSVEKVNSQINSKTTDTGISTNDIYKVNMECKDGRINLVVIYYSQESIAAQFEMNNLSLCEIGIINSPLLGAESYQQL